MNASQEHELAMKIARALNHGPRQIDAGTAEKLLTARKEALAHYSEKPNMAWTPAWAGQTVARFAEPYSYNMRAWAVILALLTTMAGAVTWQTLNQNGSEIADIDSGLLTDDLPITAYLDTGFDSWLKR